MLTLVTIGSRVGASLLSALLLASCGDDRAAPGAPEPSEPDAGAPSPPDAAPPASSDLSVPGLAVTKVRIHDTITVALLDRPITCNLRTATPVRELRWWRAGHEVGSYVPADDDHLLDFALHPSGEVTAVVAGGDSFVLLRFSATGELTARTPLDDPDRNGDPFIDFTGPSTPPANPGYAPPSTIDTARVAPLGEDVAVVTRTNVLSVVAFRYDVDAAHHLTRRFRRLVEPGVSLFNLGITGATAGTHDTFGQLDDAFHVFLDTDAAGASITIGVADTANTQAAAVLGHNRYFHEKVLQHAATTWGAVLTRIDASDGHRVVSSFVDAPYASELDGLRTIGDATYVMGRMERTKDGDGWDAYLARVDADTLARRWFRAVDVERGDLLQDVAAVAGDRLLAVGATRYGQNPNGFSISEAAPLALTLARDDGAIGARLELPIGPRHNEITSVAVDGEHVVLAGFDHGPATHTAEGNPSLMTADGFVRTMPMP